MGLDSSKDINPNAARGYILEKFTRHKGGANCMVMEPEKYLMATGGEDKSVVLWRINTTPTQSKATLKGHSDYVSCLAFHEKFVLSGSADCTIRKWCLTTHECLFVFEGHTGRINKILCAGDFIFSSSVDHTARAWTLITQKYEAMEDVCLKIFEVGLPLRCVFLLYTMISLELKFISMYLSVNKYSFPLLKNEVRSNEVELAIALSFAHVVHTYAIQS
ncbi:WD repeat-containing protein 86 [Araneus ventricosus]|uniref:WD repeat-containing protein 86 n=1 Tax=Araneus ventricosus TaxID=182803 RepID=A0A4Y2WG35_ARAVE|nr:WD repeat-containing protein 86 [Araneus ventricosus]